MINVTVPTNSTSRVVTDAFFGYNHNYKLQDGEWFDTENLTAAYYPLFSQRQKRGTFKHLTSPGGLIEKDALAYVDSGTLYYNNEPTGITWLTEGEKQLVSIGAYICIFPDKAWLNTANLAEYGHMDAHYQHTGNFTLQMCHYDGTPYSSVYYGDREPESTTEYEIWIQRTADGNTVTYSYSYSSSMWVELNTVYTKIKFPTMGQIPALFKNMDAVQLGFDGIAGGFGDINGSKILHNVGGSETEPDWVVIVYQMPTAEETLFENATISIDRNIPTMDYVCEAQNRLWGCYYGLSETGETLNELYCCSLGDFTNWSQFLGVSTDSWTASVGSDGQWTGCINLLGTPLFFKENYLHTIRPSTSGAHTVTETPMRGVQKGSWKSLVVVDEKLFYKSRSDVVMYQGSFPESVSAALGDLQYDSAVAGVYGEKLYLSMRDVETDKYSLFTFDTRKGLWMREDESQVMQFAKVDSELYAIIGNELMALNGTVGDLEEKVHWMATSGIQYYEYPDNKYVQRYNFRLNMEQGSSVKVFVDYDSEDKWELEGQIRYRGTGTVTLPIRPRRCDHMRIRLVGEGKCKIYSIARILEVGSDV